MNNQNKSIIQKKRPQKIIITQKNKTNHTNWFQCKFYNKNIPIRSYASLLKVHQQQYLFTSFYIYGGQQLMKGCLQDFYKLNFTSDNYQWQQIVPTNPQSSPGTRARHSAVLIQNKIYFYGGISNKSINNTNELHLFDITQNKWSIPKTDGQKAPPLDLHGAARAKIPHLNMLIFGGFNGQSGQYTNAVYALNIQKLKWHKVSQDCDRKGVMARRGGFSYCVHNDIIYIFGGKNDQRRFNDLWIYNIKNNSFQQVILNNQDIKPLVRNGGSLSYYQNYLLLFGGIHDITYQLDDFLIFDLKEKCWRQMQIQSARKKNIYIKQKSQSAYEGQEGLSPVQKKKKTSANNFHINRLNATTAVLTSAEKQKNSFSGNMIEEQRRKQWQLKKSKMLQEFNVNKPEEKMLYTSEPEQEAMKHSINVIKTSAPLKKSIKFETTKASFSKFNQPLANTQSQVICKKPCARDGHNGQIVQNWLFIFGGDRHQMSFNDLLKIDIGQILNKLI